MQRGDYIVAYQASEGIRGFTRLKSKGLISEGSTDYDAFELDPRSAIYLGASVPFQAVKRLPRSSNMYEFARGARGTVFRIEPGGFDRLVLLAAAYNADLSSRLLRLIS